MPTASDIARDRNTPFTQGVLMACLADAPAIAHFDVRTVGGTRFKSLARVALATAVPAFVPYNAGFPLMNRAQFAIREFNCKLAGGYYEVEPITAREWERDNPIGTPWDVLQIQESMQSDMIQRERALFYGTAIDPDGPLGLKQICADLAGNVLAIGDTAADTDFTKTVVNAGGSTANTASSVYAVKYGERDAQIIYGGDGGGELYQLGEVVDKVKVPDPAKPNNQIVVKHQQFHAHLGLSVGGWSNQTADELVPTQYSVRRLKNLTAQVGFTCDDFKLEALVASMPYRPDVLFMAPRSRRQLRLSRSPVQTVYVGGVLPGNSSANLAPLPIDFDGIPIIETRHIKANEAIEPAV